MPLDPELPELGGHLGMELDPPRLGAVDAERLVRRGLAAGEDRRARRRLEHVVVPLVDAGARVEQAEDRVVSCGLGRDDLEPAEFGLVGGEDVAAERAREDLAAQADAEHRNLALDGLTEQQPLRAERRNRPLVPGVRVPAHRHDRGEVPRLELLDGLLPRAEDPVRAARRVEPRAEQADAS